MRRTKKTNRLERSEQKRKTVEYHQAGTGMYLFRNRSSVASLELPKVSADGKKWVEPGKTWKGDSYYLTMVPKEAVLVESLCEQAKEEVKMNDKLILDQPDQVTSSGRVEHIVGDDNRPINEATPHEDALKKREKLITEDPLAGITIIRD